MINFHNAKSFCENFTAFLKCIAGFVTSLCSAECGLLRCCLRLPLRGSIWAVWHAGSACFGGRHGPFCVVLPVLWRYCLCFSVLCLQPQAVLSLRKMFSPRPCLAVSLRRLAGLRVACGSFRGRLVVVVPLPSYGCLSVVLQRNGKVSLLACRVDALYVEHRLLACRGVSYGLLQVFYRADALVVHLLDYEPAVDAGIFQPCSFLSVTVSVCFFFSCR